MFVELSENDEERKWFMCSVVNLGISLNSCILSCLLMAFVKPIVHGPISELTVSKFFFFFRLQFGGKEEIQASG